MEWLDRLMGRGKKDAGDVTGDASLRSEGMHQEAQAAAEGEERETAAEHEPEKKAES